MRYCENAGKRARQSRNKEETMLNLGSMEDLPTEYRAALSEQNLVPLWPSLRSVMPPGTPRPRTQPTAWRYADLRPLLVRAGELTPIERAERRVLVLANPGHGLEKMQASSAIYLGMQLLLPGELAPSHRHTPNAVRMVVEGEGAFTTVDGEKCPMERGDLILTPTGLWHEHGHDGDQPVVWLDVLDLPLIYYIEASYVAEGAPQQVARQGGEAAYARGGVVPSPVSGRGARRYPMLRYPWREVRAALETLASSTAAGEAVQVAYVNPETGNDCQNILGYSALMLRPGETVELPVSSPAKVFHVIEGTAAVTIGDRAFQLTQSDTCCAPGYTGISLRNNSASIPAFLFITDEGPLHRKLGVHEVRT
jgi:gentisate 1,2-dioxygenase